MLTTPDGTEVVQARALRDRPCAGEQRAPRRADAPPPPADGLDQPIRSVRRRDALPAMPSRCGSSSGSLQRAGPGRRLVSSARAAGRRRAALAASAAGGRRRLPERDQHRARWEDYIFINPDLTIYIEREPDRRVDRSRGAARDDRGRGRRSQRPSSTTLTAASAARCSRSTSPRGRARSPAVRRAVVLPDCDNYFRRKALMRTSYCCASRL